jgi:hypothetical protein
MQNLVGGQFSLQPAGKRNDLTYTFPTVAALQAAPPPPVSGHTAKVLRYHSDSADIDITYRYSTTSTRNDVLAIRPNSIPTGNPGRWLLNFTDVINVLWAGAYNNGTNPAITTAAIQGCLTFARTLGQACYAPAGRYAINDTIQILNRYSADYPAVLSIANSLIGDGAKATILEWHGTYPLTGAKKAVVLMEGYSRLENLRISSPRRYGGIFASFTTPYYGVVVSGTSWKNPVNNVDIFDVLCPLSLGRINSFGNGPSGLELDPVSGGTLLYADVAQRTFTNCYLRSYVSEFYDGGLDPATAVNNGGENLLSQTGCEADKQQTVNIIFDNCSITNYNIATGRDIYGFRVYDAVEMHFIGCLTNAPFCGDRNTYSFGDLATSFSSSLYFQDCYIIGGLINYPINNPTFGLLHVNNCEGENGGTTAFENRVIFLNSVGSKRISIDGLTVGKGTVSKVEVRIGRRTQTANIGAVNGTSFSPPSSIYVQKRPSEIYLKDLKNVDVFIGHEQVDLTRLTMPQENLLQDLATPVSLKNVGAPFVSLDQQSFGAPRPSNFSGTLRESGKTLFRYDLDVLNNLTTVINIDPKICYDFGVYVYFELNAGQSVPTGAGVGGFGPIQAGLGFLDNNLGTIAGSVALLGVFSPGFNLSVLTPGLNLLVAPGIIPPSGARFARIILTGSPPATNFAVAAIGAPFLIPSLSQDWHSNLAEGYASSSPPAQGRWLNGDRITNVANAQNASIGWRCITGGTPGVWKAISNGCNGTTAQRPVLTANDAGFDYFDSTLGRPIVWRGNAWVDATGATV